MRKRTSLLFDFATFVSMLVSMVLSWMLFFAVILLAIHFLSDSKSKTRDKSSLSDAKSKPKVKRRKIAKGLQTKEAARGTEDLSGTAGGGGEGGSGADDDDDDEDHTDDDGDAAVREREREAAAAAARENVARQKRVVEARKRAMQAKVARVGGGITELGSRRTAAPPLTAPIRPAVGDRVVAQPADGSGAWYPGVIEQVSRNSGRCTVRFDDGGVEEGLEPCAVRLAEKPPLLPAKPDQPPSPPVAARVGGVLTSSSAASFDGLGLGLGRSDDSDGLPSDDDGWQVVSVANSSGSGKSGGGGSAHRAAMAGGGGVAQKSSSESATTAKNRKKREQKREKEKILREVHRASDGGL